MTRKVEIMEEIVCYCFGYTKEEIIKDTLINPDQPAILKRILLEKRAGNCRCRETNPKGR